MGVQEPDPLAQLSLPPGFRFYPSDEELLVQYLCRKVASDDFSLQIIAEIDLYKFDPWVLPTSSGYWKATGTDKVITSEGRKVGIKKALVFYIGKAHKGTKTNWIMHEYRLSELSTKSGSSSRVWLDDWVLCRIYEKNSNVQKMCSSDLQSKEISHGSSSSSSSQFDGMLEYPPVIEDRYFSLPTRSFQQDDNKLNLQQLCSGNFDWATLAGFNSFPELTAGNQALA